MSEAPTYSSYLKLEELLELQKPLSDGPEHDETLFIIIHQVYELWFKEILHEIDYACLLMVRGYRPRVLHTLKRVLTVLKVLVAQLDILETMTPIECLSFRARLKDASGLQSFQFREREYVLGRKDPGALERFPEGSSSRAKRKSSPLKSIAPCPSRPSRLRNPRQWVHPLTSVASGTSR